MANDPDLFIVCKKCGSEVSPYVTECPYCGNRLRKRAPKLGSAKTKQQRKRKLFGGRPRLTRIRHGEIPGIRPDLRPYATILLIAISIVLSIMWRSGIFAPEELAINGKLGSEWWRVFTALFIYISAGYQFVALFAIALFGWLLERRYGFLPVIALFLLGGGFGMFIVTVANADPVAFGGNGAALALLCAWILPYLLLQDGDGEKDLLGAAAIAAVLL